MSGNGNKISWSKNGFIAFADFSENSNLSITKLDSIKGSSWRLAPRKTYQIKTNPLSKLHEIKLVQWSSAGSDLAIIDEIGNLTILGTGIIKSNQSSHQLSCFEDVEILYQDDVSTNNIKVLGDTDSFTSVIAFKWLNVDKPVISNSPAIRGEKGYTYAVHQYKSYGTLHPVQGKSGFFVIRRNGVLSFYYQSLNPTIEFKKVSVSLEDSGNVWLDHGSLGFNRDGSVIVATYSNNSLRLYKITVEYGPTPSVNLQPNIKVEKLIKEPSPGIGANGQILKLSGLKIISSNFSLDTELEILVTLTGPGVVDGKTLLRKYQISDEFKNLRFKSDSSTVNVPNLVLKSETTLQEEILSIEAKNFDFLITVVTKSGKIELRHRKSLKLHSESPTSIISLIDSGFTFDEISKSPDALSISPCLCGYVALNGNDIQFYTSSRKSQSWSDQDIIVVAASISYLFASACYTNTGADELIIVAQNLISKIEDISVKERLVLKILEESHRALNFSLDHSKDQIDRLLVNPPIQKLLSLQYSLGKYATTNQQSSIASSILNLRLISFSIMLSLRTLFHQQQRIAKKGNVESLIDALYRSESLLSTVGTINWFVEFLIFTLQELMDYYNDNNHSTIVLSLLLSKIPRSLIIYSIAGIKRIDGFLAKIEEHNKNHRQHPINLELLHKSIEKFRSLLTLADLERFERFLNQIESIIKNDGVSPLVIEQQLIFQNKVPEIYRSSVSAILVKFEEIFMGIDLASLYFHDTTWLNFNIRKNLIPSKTILDSKDPIPHIINLNDDLIDDVTKIQITNKEKLKKCVRCEYITSDNNNVFYMMGNGLTGASANHWPVAFHRTCLCGSCWVYITDDEVI